MRGRFGDGSDSIHDVHAKGAFGAYFKLPAGFAVPLHTHAHDMKVIFVSGTYVQAPEGKPEFRLGPGSYMMQPGGNYRHTTSCDKALGEVVMPSVVQGLETEAIERPLPLLGGSACGHHQPRVGCGTRVRQSKQSCEHRGHRVRTVINAELTTGANSRGRRMHGPERLRKLAPPHGVAGRAVRRPACGRARPRDSEPNNPWPRRCASTAR
jgi:hypothetical protein